MNDIFTDEFTVTAQILKVQNLIDEKIKFSDELFGDSLIELFHLTNELVTAWSCQGHADKPDWEDPYIMFYATAKGREMLGKAFDLHTKQVRADKDLSKHTVCNSTLTDVIRIGHSPDPSEECFTKVCIWEHKRVKSEAERKFVIDSFVGCLIKILKEGDQE